MAPQLVQSFPQDRKYLHTYCSVAIYILTLLLDGFKFNEHTWSNIHFSRQVNTCGQGRGWTCSGAASLEFSGPEMCPCFMAAPQGSQQSFALTYPPPNL